MSRRFQSLFQGLMAVVFLSCLAGPTGVGAEVCRLEGKDIRHQVGAGETPYLIARRYGLGSWHLRQANPGSGRLRRGAVLRVPLRRAVPTEGLSNGVVVNLPERMAYVLRGGRSLAAYPVAIGMTDPRWQTPPGRYKVVVKTVNPTWYPPPWAELEGPVPPGPENPLGEKWIGLSRKGYGLHGTTAPASVGTAASHGCMRMYRESVDALFGLVRRGTPVRITYRTVLLSRDGQGLWFLSVFPDIYGLGDARMEADRLLLQTGMADMINEDHLRSIIRNADGCPHPLFDPTRRLFLQGRVVPVRGILLDNGREIYLPREDAASILGVLPSASRSFGPPAEAAARLPYLTGCSPLPAGGCRRLLGRDYLPLSPLLNLMGATVLREKSGIYLVLKRD